LLDKPDAEGALVGLANDLALDIAVEFLDRLADALSAPRVDDRQYCVTRSGVTSLLKSRSL
jgi:hypothetical protein